MKARISMITLGVSEYFADARNTGEDLSFDAPMIDFGHFLLNDAGGIDDNNRKAGLIAGLNQGVLIAPGRFHHNAFDGVASEDFDKLPDVGLNFTQTRQELSIQVA